MAVISFSIFIASITHTTAPASTSWPCSTFTRRTVPCSGETSVPCPRRPRRPSARAGAPGALPVEFVPAATPPPVGGGPMTFTLNRRLSTSTV